MCACLPSPAVKISTCTFFFFPMVRRPLPLPLSGARDVSGLFRLLLLSVRSFGNCFGPNSEDFRVHTFPLTDEAAWGPGPTGKGTAPLTNSTRSHVDDVHSPRGLMSTGAMVSR